MPGKPKKPPFEHLHTVRQRLADGTEHVYYYHRRTRRKITGEFGSPEFLISFAEASKFERPYGRSTVGDLIRRYRESSDFRDLADSTRRDYDRTLARISDMWGNMPLDVFGDRSIRQGIREQRDRIAEQHRRAADVFVAMLSVLFNFGIDLGLLAQNHATRMKRMHKPDRSEQIWLPSDVARFEGVASPQLRLALLLALHTGQRQGDLLLLPWNAYDGTAITLQQSKTGRRVYIPTTAALRSALDATKREAITILTNQRGRPWTSDGFRTSWRKACQAAEIAGLTFHDLRGTAVTMLAEAGCTTPEIASITGHTLKSVNTILDRYLARTKPLATAAIIKLDAAARKNDSGTNL